jgi:hypothetical protein
MFHSKFLSITLFVMALCAFGCTKPTYKLRVLLKFSAEQERLNNLGQSENTLKPGNAALTPQFNGMALHYIEFAQNQLTKLGGGSILYKSAETTTNGENAIDFSKLVVGKTGETILEIPLKDVTPGTYQWVRASAAYQNYTVKFNLLNVPNVGDLVDESGTVAAFVGFNNYITRYKVKNLEDIVNANRKQGYWAFETDLRQGFAQYNRIVAGQAPAGATTVVNPLAATSPIPVGSCVVTGQFDTPLTITGTETQDLTVTLSFSINRSFEWKDTRRNGQWDIDTERLLTEEVVDMGLRGLKASWAR